MYSNEGYEQTKRYVEALDKEFPMCKNRDYIYLTKDNSSIDLSDHNFKHIRYHKLDKLFTDNEFTKLPLINDFCDYYIMRDKYRYESKEEECKDISKENYSELIDYIVYQFNRYIEDEKFPFYCARGKSDKSAGIYYQLYKLSWNFTKKGYDFTVHFESTINSLALHFERNPYIPYSKLRGKELELFNKIRAKFREKMLDISIKDVIVNRLRGNADLSIANFTIIAKTFKEYSIMLLELIEVVDKIIIDVIKS